MIILFFKTKKETKMKAMWSETRDKCLNMKRDSARQRQNRCQKSKKKKQLNQTP